MIEYSLTDTLFYFFFYSLIGWCAEVIYSSVKHRHFLNKGFLNLPLVLPYGLTAVILMHMIPTLHHQLFLQMIVSLVVFHVIWNIAEIFIQKICGLTETETSNLPTLSWKSQGLFEICASMILLTAILIIHPFIHALLRMIPVFIIRSFNLFSIVILIIDSIWILISLSRGKDRKLPSFQHQTQNLALKVTENIWNRLEKSYPSLTASKLNKNSDVFAKGICFDKFVWVFLISSFLGALIEMCFCRFSGDIWMNRSSLLYGAFSVVWGIGAVILTLTLKPLAGKPMFLIFLAGFLIGGVYEYFCSVFTEMIFGTVFWDYSHMTLHIGGRTNVLYCFFWGVLSVVWIKVLYPSMEKGIEKIPPVYGKIITWFIVVVMTFNSVLTICAMLRYTQRKTHPLPENAAEAFFDNMYDDEWMEHRWPNMKFTNEKA